MSKLKIQTTQNVELDLELPGMGVRLLSGGIDSAILFIYACFLYWAALQMELDKLPDTVQFMIYLFVYLIPASLYFPALEIMWKGQTVGKRIMRCRVVKVDGKRLSLGDVLLRWLLRNIDVSMMMLYFLLTGLGMPTDIRLLIFFWMFPLPIVGIACMAMTKNEQRLGDLAANTTVIRLKRHVSLQDTILVAGTEEYKPQYLNVLQLSDRDIRIIKETLQDYERTKDPKNVRLLAKKAKDILGVTEKVKPLNFLKTLMKDYNHLANKNA